MWISTQVLLNTSTNIHDSHTCIRRDCQRQRTGIQAHSRRVSSLLVTLNLAGSSCKETFRFRKVMTLHHKSEASSYVSDKGTNIPFAWQIKKRKDRKDEKRLNYPRSP